MSKAKPNRGVIGVSGIRGRGTRGAPEARYMAFFIKNIYGDFANCRSYLENEYYFIKEVGVLCIIQIL